MVRESSSGVALWRSVGATVRGAGHERSGGECQDAHGWTLLDQGLALAVADGAGSAARGRLGAERATEAALRSVAAAGGMDERDPMLRALQVAMAAARDALATEAMRLGIEERELATTLILVLASPVGVAAAQVGDGAVVLRTPEGALTALTRPPVDEYLNETMFLTSERALESVQTAFAPGPAAQLALFTDGLQMLALRMPQGEPHAPFFAPLFRFAAENGDPDAARAQLEQFLRSPRIIERTDDDLTLLLATLNA